MVDPERMVSKGRLKAGVTVASACWFVLRLSLALLVISGTGCSDDETRHVAAKSEPLRPAKDAHVSPEEEAIVLPAETVFQPVLAALETYHRKHGHYPAALDGLVNDFLLPKVPELPPVKGALESGLEYHASLSPDFFVIMFHYNATISTFSFGLHNDVIDSLRRVYASDDRRGWVKLDSPFVAMGDLIADRLAPLWRKKHQPELLRRLVIEAIGSADCKFLLQWKVVDWLGKGSEIRIPPEVLGSDRTGFCYQADGDPNRRYCFVYKKHWFGQFTCPSGSSAEALTKGPLVFTNRPVLDRLFLLRQEGSGRESWELIRACPPSDDDRRPKSSPGREVRDD